MSLIDKYINEAKGEHDKIMKDLGRMTSRNDHDSARIAVAKYMKNKRLEKIYTGIQMINSTMGHMDHRISEFRYSIDKEMLVPALKQKYGEEIGQAIWMKF